MSGESADDKKPLLPDLAIWEEVAREAKVFLCAKQLGGICLAR
ncbi:hypothetical protein PsAD2_00760 [Pseudovibrio axinellae]|uniref:Uncharacterized protein n=1 Tax=Pseudovibrio axinellae TaxID=989403 RepID=A0A166ARJ4_9HYPH|nr:hypothetical protein PsAD2_00760 [Pseudovibrio axinellae]SER06246.1 hypothetical protein SAMN05421798_10632 [Pseudovibrio axinellae]